MRAAPIGVDRPAEGEAGGVWDAVDDRPGLDLEERHATERWCVEGPPHRALLEQHWGGRRTGFAAIGRFGA